MANIENDEKATKDRVAVKFYIDANGNKVDGIDKALGVAYQAIGQDRVFKYIIPNAVAGEEIAMLALFGATTKATNVRSTAYQLRDKVSDPAADMEAVEEWFRNLAPGVWPESKGQGGPRFDIPVLAEAWGQTLKEAGKKPGKVEDRIARLESDADLYKTVRTNPKVLSRYYALQGNDEGGALPE